MNALDSSTGFLSPDFINLGLTGGTAFLVVRELHAGIRNLDTVADPDGLLRDLLARQALSDNCLDAEVALPHVRTVAVNRMVLAIGRSDSGVDFGVGHRSVRLVCLIAAPSESLVDYLRCAARIARALRNKSLRAEFFNSQAADAFRRTWTRGVLSGD